MVVKCLSSVIPCEELWGHIDISSRVRSMSGSHMSACCSKVSQLYFVARKAEEVARLHISVDKVPFVKMLYTFQELLANVAYPGLLQRSIVIELVVQIACSLKTLKLSALMYKPSVTQYPL